MRGAATGGSVGGRIRLRRLLPLLLLLLGVATVVGSCTRVVGVETPLPPVDPTVRGVPGPVATPPPLPPPPVAPPPPPGAIPTPFREVRALWVVRTALVHPDSVRAMVDRAHRGGFNTLLVQVRGRGDAFYLGGREPRAVVLSGQPPDFDPLGLVLREAHARGMEVHAWMNTHLVSSAILLPVDPSHIVNTRPDLLAVPRALATRLNGTDPRDRRYVELLAAHARENATRVEGIYTSPSHPEVKAHLRGVWGDLLRRYPVDGVHLDYMRYPAPDFDHSAATLRAFRDWLAPTRPPAEREGLDGASRGDPLAWVDAHPREWEDFRRMHITGLLEEVVAEVRALRPGIAVSVAVLADREDARRARFQDWGDWLTRGVVDAVAPMAYTPDDLRFREQIRGAVQVGGGSRVWAGIGIYQTTFQGAVTKAGIAREEGAAGLVLFSYDWAVGEEGRRAGGAWLDRFSETVFGR